MRALATLAVATTMTVLPLGLSAPSARADADGCEVGVTSDFNGDGRTDAVVADPTATVSGQAAAGRIIVLYGDADGLIGEGTRGALSEGSGSVLGAPEAGDRFGFSLAVLDVDCDGYTDVAVGVPYEDIGASTDVGMVHVVWGSPAGLGLGDSSTIWRSTSFGQTEHAGDRFGFAVDGVEDDGQGGTPAPDAYVLAIGVPGAVVSGHDNAGAVALRAPLDGGGANHWLTQDTPGLPGAAEAGDGFGSAVSCNYLIGGGEFDCIVGSPGEDVGSAVDAGTASVINDIYFEDEYTGTTIDQNSSGVPGVAEAGDRYGAAVDTILVGTTARAAIAAPGEDVGSANGAGSVQLFSSNTTTLNPGTGLSQNTSGVGGSAESGDAFGSSLAWIAPGLGDSQTRLAVGVPTENTTAGTDAGIVQVFPMSSLGSDVTWSQNSSGVPGVAQAGDRFGAAVATVAGASERALLIGVPDDVTDATGMVDVIPFGGGNPRGWIPGTGGIPSSGLGRWGFAIGGVSGGGE